MFMECADFNDLSPVIIIITIKYHLHCNKYFKQSIGNLKSLTGVGYVQNQVISCKTGENPPIFIPIEP